jgi:hypothetical protein
MDDSPGTNRTLLTGLPGHLAGPQPCSRVRRTHPMRSRTGARSIGWIGPSDVSSSGPNVLAWPGVVRHH